MQRKPSLSSPPISPISPVANPVLRQHSAPILNAGPYSVQPIPLPPLRSRKRTEAQSSPLSPKVILFSWVFEYRMHFYRPVAFVLEFPSTSFTKPIIFFRARHK